MFYYEGCNFIKPLHWFICVIFRGILCQWKESVIFNISSAGGISTKWGIFRLYILIPEYIPVYIYIYIYIYDNFLKCQHFLIIDLCEIL